MRHKGGCACPPKNVMFPVLKYEETGSLGDRRLRTSPIQRPSLAPSPDHFRKRNFYSWETEVSPPNTHFRKRNF